MSLSFVSSAVLSSTDGVSHNEEISVESKEVNQLRLKNSNAHRPLFEQLRSNREADQEKYDETTKAMRMGMRPLDEEDCAHLDTVESMRNEREQKVRREMEEEIALYRAAKAEMNFDKKEQQNDVKEEEEEDDDTKKIESNDLKSNHSILKPSTTIAPVVPIIVGKRKRRTQTSKSSTNNKKINKHSRSSADKKQETNDTATNTSTAITELKAKKPTPTKKENAQYNQSDDDDDDDEVNGSLGGLLGGYGSDSD